VLIKGEGDASSIPSGGLRHTHLARGYTIWDHLSQLYIRRKHGVMYLPSLQISHLGHALDDKTLFRQCQKAVKTSTIELLSKLGVKTNSAVMLVGLEQ
jgi:glutamine synthetase